MTFLWILLGIVYVACWIYFGLATFRRRHYWLFWIGFFLPFLWIVGALIPPPNTPPNAPPARPRRGAGTEVDRQVTPALSSAGADRWLVRRRAEVSRITRAA